MTSGQGSKNRTQAVIVNAQPKTVEDKDISFEEVVALAFDPVPSGENIVITVSFSKGTDAKKEGTLQAGQTVKVKDGMVFDVTATDKS